MFMKTKKAFALSAVPAVLLVLSPAAPAAQDGGFALSVGGEYTTGDYGTSEDTEIWYFPLTFSYETDRSSLGITVPLVIVDGPGTVVPSIGGGAGMHSGRTATRSQTESGLGDLLLRGSFNLVMEDRYSPRLDLTGKIKFGTADRDDNLGTGEDDFAVQVDVERNFDVNQLFGSLGYKFMGDPPDINYDNVLYGTVGAAHRFSDTTSVGLALDAQQAVVDGEEEKLELTVFLSARADPKTKVTGYVLRGLADGSPDWGVGILVKLSQ
jgi:hypothetical protein